MVVTVEVTCIHLFRNGDQIEYSFVSMPLSLSKPRCHKKKDWIKHPIVCSRQNLKPDYFDRRYLGETTLHATSLDLRSEDYESKAYKTSLENPCCYDPSRRCFIDTFTN